MRTWSLGLWSVVLAILWLGSGQAHAAASLALSGGSGAPGDIVELTLTLDADQPLSAAQADIRFDPELFSAGVLIPQPPVGAILESELLAPGHLRVVLYSLSCPGSRVDSPPLPICG